MFLYSDANRYQGNAHAFIDDTGRALFEIADDKSRFKLGEKTLREGRKSIYALHEVLDHPELFDNYPRLRKSVVILPFDERQGEDAKTPITTLGQYHPLKNHDSLSESYKSGGVKALLSNIGRRMAPLDYIDLHGRETFSPEDIRSTLLHEVQHKIQGRAGAIPRTNESFDVFAQKFFSQDGQFDTDLKDMQNDPNTKVYGTRQLKRDLDRATLVGDSPFAQAGATPSGRDYINYPQAGAFFDDKYPSGIVRRYHQHEDLAKTNFLGIGQVRYFYSPHEIMARETQSRVNLTLEQRLGIRPQLAATWPTSLHTVGPSRPILGPGSKPVKFFSAEERPVAEANLAKEERTFREVHERAKGAEPTSRFNILKGTATGKAMVLTSALASAAALLMPAAGNLLGQNTDDAQVKIRTTTSTPNKPEPS